MVEVRKVTGTVRNDYGKEKTSPNVLGAFSLLFRKP